jgi:mannan endo-1,6-alpha-mannosidase
MLARDLARTAQIAPFTADTIMPLLQSSAQAVASVGCASSGEKCGFYWRANANDENSDLGSQFSALEVIQANLVPASKGLAIGSSSPNSSTPGSGTGTASGTATSASPSKGAGRRLGADVWEVAMLALTMIGLFALRVI